MHDVEIERRLRLPAPDEPTALPALVLDAGADERRGANGFAVPAADRGYAVRARLEAPPTRAWWRGPRTVREAMSALAVLALAALVVAVIGIASPSNDKAGGIPPTLGPVASAPMSSPVTTPRPDRIGTDNGSIAKGRYELPWPQGPAGGRIHLTVPSGWSWIGTGPTTIYRDEGRLYGFPVALTAHSVYRIATSVCAADASAPEVGPTFADVGPTVEDLTAAIENVGGTRWSGPSDVTIGGYPAKRLTTTYDAASCPGPARRWIWSSDAGAFFVENGVTTTVDVVDVNRHRLVLVSEVRRGSSDAQLAEVFSSIGIDPPTVAGPTSTAPPPSTARDVFPESMGPDGALRIGRHRAIVEGVPFTFSVETRGWEPQLGFSINRSTIGPQSAEATVRWTTFPDGRNTDPCPGLMAVGPRPTVGQLAAAVAAAPGVDLVTGPADAVVGGRAATQMVLKVREDVGCDPGYFHTYEPLRGGALWTQTKPGDTIMVWIVDLDGTIVFIEAEHRNAGPGVERDMGRIVDSMRFE